jgi:hypothetical protein
LAQSGLLPCSFTGQLRRNEKLEVVWYNLDEMKRRAVHKVDIDGPLKQMDIKGTAILDVLVAPSGNVVCVKSSSAHPMIRIKVENAVRHWTFRTETSSVGPIAYLGRVRFVLCNILCGEKGPSMTLLK